MPTVEICYSPALFPFISPVKKGITVVIDVLRATTSFCTAFDYGVEGIVPLNSLELAREYKQAGHLVAAERDGMKPDFADFSNSAFDFMVPEIKGKTIYYTTTNGTAAIKLASEVSTVAIASFLNIPAMVSWLVAQQQNVVLLCAGWKNNYCIEDTLCAAAIAERLLADSSFTQSSDSTKAALELWKSCNNEPEALIMQSEHYNRLVALGFEKVLPYSLQIGKSNSVPVFQKGIIIDRTRLASNKN